MQPFLDALKVRFSQGKQFVPDVRAANPVGFRGLPVIDATACQHGCTECADVCPSNAIKLQSFALDLGRCVFCDDCARVCPQDKIQFTAGYRLASRTRDGLVVREGSSALGPVEASAAIRKIFGRSLKLRSVSAGGCNGCELEINATANVNFDSGRYGIDIVASPRHADGLILSGPITARRSICVIRACPIRSSSSLWEPAQSPAASSKHRPPSIVRFWAASPRTCTSQVVRRTRSPSSTASSI